MYGSNVLYPPVNPRVYDPSVATTHWRTNTLKKLSFQTSVYNRYNIYIYICTYITEYSIESFFDNFRRPLRNFMSMFVCKNIEDEEVCVKAR